MAVPLWVLGHVDDLLPMAERKDKADASQPCHAERPTANSAFFRRAMHLNKAAALLAGGILWAGRNVGASRFGDGDDLHPVAGLHDTGRFRGAEFRNGERDQ